jgi:hypothetical protein
MQNPASSARPKLPLKLIKIPLGWMSRAFRTIEPFGGLEDSRCQRTNQPAASTVICTSLPSGVSGRPVTPVSWYMISRQVLSVPV